MSILNLATSVPEAVNPNFFSQPKVHFVVQVAPDTLRPSPFVSISPVVITGANHVSKQKKVSKHCQERSISPSSWNTQKESSRLQCFAAGGL